MKVIIAGASGMVGMGVLQQAIAEPAVTEILVINRSAIGLKDAKVKEVIHAHFFDLSDIRDLIKGYDACLFCAGVSSVGMKEEKYHELTYTLTTAFARDVLSENPDMTFCYISGKGTDSSAAGKVMWARVKGATENALMAMPFASAYMFRPGFIQPFDGFKAKAGAVNLLYAIFSPFYFLLKKFPGYVTDTRTLGKAMVRVAMHGYEKKILESRDINLIGQN